ncbi:MAG TPA: hypothetical protein VN673_14480 [Clostridia bacterium]|nr:hypothetical protein [Clostridia bacterium]
MFNFSAFKSVLIDDLIPWVEHIWHVDDNGHDFNHWKDSLWWFAQHILKNYSTRSYCNLAIFKSKVDSPFQQFFAVM